MGLQLARCIIDEKGIPIPQEGTEFEVEADLIVSAIGQGGDLTGLEKTGKRQAFNRSGCFFIACQVAMDTLSPAILFALTC
ncbi:MAG: hypothetical protein CM1200mP41_00180 [Gammaproteobacteria bacterium]|nr:MAG: hypothetical protein CM1200mP41_00180 [Gammaproteobacteria bacterium]